jgi:membrane fusion protein, multidrug efflux system
MLMGIEYRQFLPLTALRFALVTAVALASFYGEAESAEDESVLVEATPVTVRALERTIQAVGSLRSQESVIIRPEIPGIINSIDFKEGQAVEKGQLLITIRDGVPAADLYEAQAQLRLSIANEKRARELAAKGSGTVRSLDEAKASKEVNLARVALAKARVAKYSLRAPFDGVLGLRRVSAGDYLIPGQDVVNLEAVDTLKVDFRIPETYFSLLKVDQRVNISVDAYKGRSFSGTVYAIDPLVDPEGRSIAVRARILNPDSVLAPGLFARVSLIVNVNGGAILIPEQATMPRGKEQFVFRIIDGKVSTTKVVPGQRREGMVEIVEGLSAGDIVVTAGHLKLRDGTAIRLRVPEEG